MEKVSVVIPCHNAERFLSETVESALRQDYPDFEIVVVDDGSTDGTAKLIRSFGSQVRAEFGPNRGASAARNRGTALSTGSFIQYLDADDLLLPGAIKKRVDALAATGADVAYSDWQRLEEQSDGVFSPGEVVSRTMEDVHPDPQIACFSDFWSPPAALLYRRAIVDRIGSWNESLPVIQDARFLLDAALHGARFAHVSGVGAYYRVHREPSLSRRDPVGFVRDCFRNATQVEEWFCHYGGLTAERRQAVHRVYEVVARGSVEHDPATFEMACQALERLCPRYCPDRGFFLVVLSRLFGYRRAEGIALRCRRLKRLLSHGMGRSSVLP